MPLQTIVLTTIHPPTEAVRRIAALCPDWTLLVIGDKKTPAGWGHTGVRYISAAEQIENHGAFASALPFHHYTRKNLGYLWSIANGAAVIAETDDDNVPYDSFLRDVARIVRARPVLRPGWENVYTHFTRDRIWPRGFPLELITDSLERPSTLGESTLFDCPIQQFLADGDPDVDAVYRLTTRAETRFEPNTVALSKGCFCPFNSQNTVWWPDAYPLMYLPSHVNFRMTDIWRSFIAEACLYAMGKSVAFRDATVYQERNQHSLIRDFHDETPGYLHNARIVEILAGLPLAGGPRSAGDNIWTCYEALVHAKIVPKEEMKLLEMWLTEVGIAEGIAA